MSQSPFQPIAEHTLTDFLQHSGRVLAAVDRGGILLHRRDGEDLMVMTRGQSEALGATLRALAAAVLVQRSGRANRTKAVHDGVAAVLPWLSFLSAAERSACLHELSEVASAAVATGQLDHLEETLDQWRATALAAWDERRRREREDAAEYLEDAPIALARP